MDRAGDKNDSNAATPMDPSYFEVRFRTTERQWPEAFFLITAAATTGEVWPAAREHAAAARLEAELRSKGVWMAPITGYSVRTGHAEVGWAVELPELALRWAHMNEACALGRKYLQDAIYIVVRDELWVLHCAQSHDARAATDHAQAVPAGAQRVGAFRERIDPH